MLYFFRFNISVQKQRGVEKSFYKKFAKNVGYIKKSSTFALTNNR